MPKSEILPAFPKGKLGVVLTPEDQKAALRLYTNRYTRDHKPEWAMSPRPNGEPYPVQYASDGQWLARTRFPTIDGRLTSGNCYSFGHTWPDGLSNTDQEFLGLTKTPKREPQNNLLEMMKIVKDSEKVIAISLQQLKTFIEARFGTSMRLKPTYRSVCAAIGCLESETGLDAPSLRDEYEDRQLF